MGVKTRSVPDLKDYLSDRNSVCREERQYALYLFNELCDQGRIDIDGSSYEIVECYYEVSILRDYFEQADDKRGFNLKLIDHSRANCNAPEKLKDAVRPFDIKKLDKHINVLKDEDWKNIGTKLPLYIINAQPDIGLILKRENRFFLCFIECKYCSGFSKYPTKDVNREYLGDDGRKYDQLEVQRLIADFICSEEAGLGMRYHGKKLSMLKDTPVIAAVFKGKRSGRIKIINTFVEPQLCIDQLIKKNDDKTALSVRSIGDEKKSGLLVRQAFITDQNRHQR